MSIKNIVFDMGNVLIKFSPETYLDRYVKNEEDKNLLNIEVFKSIDWLRADRGTLSVENAIENVKNRIDKKLHYCIEDLFHGWYNDLEPILGMDNIVKTLYESGYTLYLLSNANICYYKARTLIPGIKYFSGEFISSDHKTIKPHREIYNMFLEKFNIKANETIFIDDSPLNIDGAIEADINGIIFHDNIDKLKEDFNKYNIKI